MRELFECRRAGCRPGCSQFASTTRHWILNRWRTTGGDHCRIQLRTQTLTDLTPYEYIGKIWTSEPDESPRQPNPPDAGA